jgi:transcriptional regulator with XRE-family HTH domain
MITDVTEKIKMRRKELGLTDVEASKETGLSIYEYGDIEQHADEIFAVTSLSKVKEILRILKLDFFELFEIHCVFCGESQACVKEYALARHELIRKRREGKGLSREELGNRLGFYEAEIENLETYPDHLETWPIDLIKSLATELNVPIQILLNLKCTKCALPCR